MPPVFFGRTGLYMLVMIDNYDSFTYNVVQYLCELKAEVRVARATKVWPRL